MTKFSEVSILAILSPVCRIFFQVTFLLSLLFLSDNHLPCYWQTSIAPVTVRKALLPEKYFLLYENSRCYILHWYYADFLEKTSTTPRLLTFSYFSNHPPSSLIITPFLFWTWTREKITSKHLQLTALSATKNIFLQNTYHWLLS